MGEQRRVLRALEALKKACKDLQQHENPSKSSSMRALLELETESDDLFYGDPELCHLSLLLSRLRTLSQSQQHRGLLVSFTSSNKSRTISNTAASIESEIQSWIDRESLHRLASALRSPPSHGDDDDEILNLLAFAESRLARGFDRGLQVALLRSGIFQELESALTDTATSKQVKEGCAAAIAAMVWFNRDVFVGQVLVGSSVRSLVAMASPASTRALHALLEAIRSPLVDEIESNGEIPKIVGLLREGAEHAEAAAAAVEVVMNMGFYGRKEAVEGMVKSGVVERLVALQRADGDGDEDERRVRAGVMVTGSSAGWRPFAGCVARFAVQVEVGNGLRGWEKRQFKAELMRRVRAVSTDSEAANIMVEVLWGTTP